MIYSSAQDWHDAPHKRVALIGMSGLGKTHISSMLRKSGDWFHYSVDYRIGTRYMNEYIADNFKAEALKNPFLAELLRSDSVYIASNITFDNLAPLASYLGKPGDPAQGGLPIAEYQKRQAQHFNAERAALLDTQYFIERAQRLYQYDHFVCDTGGSICEVVDPEDRDDPVMQALSDALLLVWIEGSDAHTDALIKRFDAAPKPMCYQPEFLLRVWDEYLRETNTSAGDVNPDDFIRFAFARALAHRQPRYAAMARNWGITLDASDVAAVRTPDDFNALIARALEARA